MLFSNDENPHELVLNNPETLKNATFNEEADFKFIIHGYTQSKDTPMMAHLREGKILLRCISYINSIPIKILKCDKLPIEYFKNEEWNLIYIDYQPLAIQGCYYGCAVPSAAKIGECAASLLKQLFNERPEVTIDQFHFIGFSLGAQICAQISKHLQPLKIPRITGEQIFHPCPN